MAGPGGPEVGRVSVRVVPDTDGFRNKLRRELAGDTAGIDAEIDVEPDGDGLRAKLQAIAAAASRGVRAEIDVYFDEDQLRRLGNVAGNQFNRGFNRGFGGARGSNLVTRQFSQTFFLIRQLGSQTIGFLRLIRSNWQAVRRANQAANRAMRETAERAARVREATERVGDATRDARNNLNEIREATERTQSSASNLPVLWRDANRSMEDLARNIREAADRDNEIQVRPELDNSAWAKFRRDLKSAIDTIRQDVDAGRVFVADRDGLREITAFDNALRRVTARVVTIARFINRITRATTLLRFAWNGLVSVVRGTPGWIRRIGRVVFDLRGNFERLVRVVGRARDAIRQIPVRLAGLNDSFQRGFIRVWVELDRAAGNALMRIRAGINSVQTAYNRFNLLVENGSRRLIDGWNRATEAANRMSARVYDVGVRVSDIARRWSEAMRVIANGGGVIETLRRRFDSIDNKIFDIRRGLALAADQIDVVASRVNNRLRTAFDSATATVLRFGRAIRGIDAATIRRGVVSAGDSVVRFGRRSANAVRGIRQGFSALGSLGVAAFRGIGSAVSAAGGALRSGFGSALEAAKRGFSNLRTFVSGFGTAILGIVGTIAQLAAVVGVLGAISAVLVVLGAAITAAWAGISTVIATIPGLLLLIAGPAAAVLTGIEGIKRAAATIKPEFDKLRESVAATFERGMTPVFRTLADKVFPTLKTGLNGVAEGVVFVASELTKVVSSDAGLKLLGQTFENIKTAVKDLSPAINDIVLVMLEMGAMQSMFKAITGFIKDFASEWRNSITRLSQGGEFSALNRAFQGLEQLLGAVARAFAGLIENGIRAFAGAAPGLTKSLDSLTNFFSRFDWERLGVAVGNVFQGMGEMLDGVDVGTIEAITQAFERLGETFRNPQYQTMFRQIIEAIPGVLGAFDSLIGGFLRVATGALGLVNIFAGVGRALGAFFMGLYDIIAGVVKFIITGMEAINSPIDAATGKFNDKFAEARDQIMGAFEGDPFGKAADDVRKGMDQLKLAFSDSSLPATAGKLGTAVFGSFEKGTRISYGSADAAARSGVAGLESTITTGTAKIPPKVGSALAPLPGAVESGLAPVPGVAAGILNQVSPVVDTAFGGLAVHATLGMTAVANAVQASGAKIGNSLRIGLQVLPAVITQAFAGVNTQIIAAVNVWALSVQLGVGRMATAVSVGMAPVSAAVGLALSGINTRIIAAVAVWALSVQLGMQRLASGATVGFSSVSNAVGTALAQINTRIIAGVAVWALSMQFGVQRIGSSITAGFAAISAAVGAGLTGVNSRIIGGVNVWALSVQLGMSRIVQAVTQGFAQITAAVVSGMSRIVQSAISGMAAFSIAVTFGMARVVIAIQSGLSRAASAAQSFVGRFRTIGAQMGQGLADGLNSRLGTVQAAARRLASAAATATAAAAQVRSPSRVFMRLGAYLGEGLAVGMDDSRNTVRSSARRLISEVVRVSDQITESFDVADWSVGMEMPSRITRVSTGEFSSQVTADGGGIAEAVAEALAGWGVQIDGNGLAKLVNKSNTRRARRG